MRSASAFMGMPSGVSSSWTRTSYQRSGIPTSCSSSVSSTSTRARALSKKSRHARRPSAVGLDKASCLCDCPSCNCSPRDSCGQYQTREGEAMAVVADERAKLGYGLGADDGEAFWLLGMLETIKIGGADTGGGYGLLEIVVRAGEGSPWHVHPDEDEWF